MTDFKKEAKKARKQIESLDIDIASIRDRRPTLSWSSVTGWAQLGHT